MKIIKNTFQYMFSNFLWLLPGVILPAFLFGFFSTGKNVFSFLFEYSSLTVEDFGDITVFFLDANIFGYVFPVVTVFVLAVLGFSLNSSVIEEHLRVGRRSLKHPFEKINNSIVAVLPMLVIIGALYVVWSLLISSLILLSHYAFSGLGNHANIGTILVAFILIIVFIGVFVYAAELILFFIPCKLIVGYNFNEAISVSVGLLYNAHLRAYFACLLPFVVYFFAELALYFSPGGYIRVVFTTIFSAIVMLYYMVLAFVGYFDIEKLQRKDRKYKYYQNLE